MAELQTGQTPMEVFGDEHGSAAVVTTTAAPGHWDAHSLAPGAHAAIPRHSRTTARSASRTPGRGRTGHRHSAIAVPEKEPEPKRRAASFRSAPRMAHTPEATAPGASAAARATPPETTAWPGKLRQLEAQREIDS